MWSGLSLGFKPPYSVCLALCSTRENSDMTSRYTNISSNFFHSIFISRENNLDVQRHLTLNPKPSLTSSLCKPEDVSGAIQARIHTVQGHHRLRGLPRLQQSLIVWDAKIVSEPHNCGSRTFSLGCHWLVSRWGSRNSHCDSVPPSFPDSCYGKTN